MINYC